MNRNHFTLVPILILTILIACRAPLKSNQRGSSALLNQPTDSKQSVTDEPDIMVSEFLSEIPLVDKKEQAGLLQAWKRTPNHDHYRKARPSDFLKPDWNESEYDRSYEYGEIAGAYGLGMFVIDTTVPKPRNFGFVVFIRRPGNKYDLYWIFRQENLSGLKLSRSSGDIYLDGVRDAGTDMRCEIQWEKDQHRWACSSP